MSSHEIVRHRPLLRRPLLGDLPLAVLREQEAADRTGTVVDVQTLFLRGSECRFRCLMCDLWQYTHQEPTAAGAITAQIRSTLAQVSLPQWIKLYNASNFFDPLNIPRAELPAIGHLLSGIERVIVENHPRVLPKDAITSFREGLTGALEVAIGLETVEPVVLERLNKQMTLDDFARAVEWYSKAKIDTRAFVLLRPPWLDEQSGIDWCLRSVKFAFACGVRHVSIIPVRGGNGMLEHLASQGEFEPPLARSLESVFETALVTCGASVITVDLWDWRKMRGHCGACEALRLERLTRMNLLQRILPRVECPLNCEDLR